MYTGLTFLPSIASYDYIKDVRKLGNVIIASHGYDSPDKETYISNISVLSNQYDLSKKEESLKMSNYLLMVSSHTKGEPVHLVSVGNINASHKVSSEEKEKIIRGLINSEQVVKKTENYNKNNQNLSSILSGVDLYQWECYEVVVEDDNTTNISTNCN